MRRARPRNLFPLPAGITLPVQCGPGLAEQLARPLGRGERLQPGECLIDHLGGFLPESALPESSSKSACAFPITSIAAFVLASSAVSFSFSFRSRSLSTSAWLRPGRPGGLTERPLSRASRPVSYTHLSTEAELVTPDESDPLDVPRNERLRDRVFEDLAGLILDDFNRAVVREGVLGRSPGVQNGEGAPSDQGVLRGVGWRIGTRSQSRLRVGYP